MIILWGNPGVGKTHLQEAIVNHIAQVNPAVLARLYLSRYDFTLENLSSAFSYGGCPVILIDDMYARHQSVESLHPNTDLDSFKKFISRVYENRCLVIVTTNFQFKDGILQRVKSIDKIGRVTSRMNELMACSGEIHLKGPDYRCILADEKLDSDLFAI